MKKLILVRHGQGENNLHKYIGGWSDAKLTELGIRQAEAVAEKLMEELKEPFRFYSSDLTRARQTAEVIAGKLGVEASYVEGLREHDAGVANGMPIVEALKLKVEADPATMDWRLFPEAESWGEFYGRVSGFMEGLSGVDEPVLIVSHGGTIANIVKWWIGLPPSMYFDVSFKTSNTSLTVLDVDGEGRKRVERLNDTAHYSSIGLDNPL